MSILSFEAANFSRQNGMFFVVLTPCSAIVASRKRKLRELFAVATHVEGLSHDGITKPDAPPTTQAENDFLLANDIFQYVGAID